MPTAPIDGSNLKHCLLHLTPTHLPMIVLIPTYLPLTSLTSILAIGAETVITYSNTLATTMRPLSLPTDLKLIPPTHMLLLFCHCLHEQTCHCSHQQMCHCDPVTDPMNRVPLPQSTYRKPSINTTSISITSIIMVELFVTMARLAWGQTSVLAVKIGAHNGYKIVSVSVKNVLACINTLYRWE